MAFHNSFPQCFMEKIIAKYEENDFVFSLQRIFLFSPLRGASTKTFTNIPFLIRFITA